ncbi:hypothetical protein RHSIM_Rhsim05G0225900 [Rhododendron simsii]|uniref:Uncharacterized protein n=1 Tax=Rhododendron simsii TaxID=118357 RepID=A0A834GZV3_RHOSS|nr:hypothetical protein RHSIM_Rhsim05G0225900 [Rhododendron simsii]
MRGDQTGKIGRCIRDEIIRVSEQWQKKSYLAAKQGSELDPLPIFKPKEGKIDEIAEAKLYGVRMLLVLRRRFLWGSGGKKKAKKPWKMKALVINMVEWDEGWDERRAKLEAIKKQRAVFEMEPCCDGNLVFDAGRVAALLMLGISAPLSNEKHMLSIPRRIFHYTVELLGRISHALSDDVDHDTLLAYLYHCSSSRVISFGEFDFKRKELFLPVEDGSTNNAIYEKSCSADMQAIKWGIKEEFNNLDMATRLSEQVDNKMATITISDEVHVDSKEQDEEDVLG